MRAQALLAWVCLSAGALAPAQGVKRDISPIRAVHERAIEDPFDEDRFREYVATLPRDGMFYVVEGDMLKTAAEVREYLAAESQSQGRAGILPELLVNLHDGQRDYYQSADDRRLRYFVDRGSFATTERYERALTAVRKAAAEWEYVCPECQLKLVEIEAPPNGADARTGFVIREHDVQGAYIAAAFFPHDPPARRILRIDPSFFATSFDAIGVLRHELGHVLGYRHEHTRGVPGCGFEDNNWQPLTPYDPHSVMHYFCGGGGSLRLDISRADIAGHRALYGGPSTTALVAPPGGGAPAAVETLRRLEAAEADPFDEAKRQALFKMLPRAGNYYIIEGDLRMTEAEVTAYLAATGDSQTPPLRNPELIVNLHRGAPDFYPIDKRTLTYVVDRGSFGSATRYDEAARAMQEATKEWQATCGECKIVFRHLREFDDKPGAADANFTVRLFDAGGEFIAAAFFPHDPPARRLVDIDPSFYTTTFDRVGVLRHELGHVLGYRHEHIRGVPGCFREDNQWRPLTPYDPKSVMHYFCGGAGNLKLEITQTDRSGHHQLYGPQRSPNALQEPEQPVNAGVLVVSFEGGEVVDNAAQALMILNQMKLLPVAAHAVAPGERIESIYREHLGLPAYSEAVTRLANWLNRADYSKNLLSIGQQVRYPDVRFVETTFGKVVDQAGAAQIEQNWKHVIVEQSQKTAPSADPQRLELRRYELRLPVKDAAQLEQARARVNELGRNVLAGVEIPSPTKARYYTAPRPSTAEAQSSYNSAEQMIANKGNLKEGEQVTMLSLLGLTELSGNRTCSGVACPEVVLVDNPLVLHPDLKDAVGGEDPDRTYENAPLIVGGRQTFEMLDWNDAYHSTYLAGIIGSRDNTFGLVGVDPQARIIWWNWEDLGGKLPTAADKVTRRQTEAQNSGAFQIYVFATRWLLSKAPTTEEGRFSDDVLSKRLDDEKPLVVAAAGEPDLTKNELEEKIAFSTKQAPINQGDLPHVLVVTGCDPCGNGARLLAHTNYSRTFVHVAAPSSRLLSTAWGAKYTIAPDGTSQATAFVAGLASAMVARYPLSYKHASQVKTRLQVTSTPIELLGAPDGLKEGGKLSAGIIDPGLATLDPRVHWLKSTGADRRAYQDISWNVETLSIEVGGVKKRIPTDEIWRVVTRNGKSVVFTGPVHGPIEKFGPGVLTTADPSRPVCTLDKKTSIMLGLIEDLALKYPIQ